MQPKTFDVCVCGHIANAHLTVKTGKPDKWEYCCACECKQYLGKK